MPEEVYDLDDLIQLTPGGLRERPRFCLFCQEALYPAWERRPRMVACPACIARQDPNTQRYLNAIQYGTNVGNN